MSQNSIEGLPRFIGYNVLVLNTRNDFQRPATPAAGLYRAAFGSILKTRLRRCAQVIAAWHSAGVFTSAFAPILGALPRLAGVTSPRQRWFGPGRAGQNAVVAGLCRVPNYADLVVGRWKFLR